MPIDLADAKRHLRLDHDEEDAYVSALIGAAERQIENLTAVVCTPRDESFAFDGFSAELAIPRVPVDFGSVVATYLDPDGAEQALAKSVYRLASADGIARIVLAPGQSWPSALDGPGAVTVTASIGHAAGAAPESLKHAARLLVGHWFQNRETVTTGTIVADLPHAARQLMALERVIFP